MAKIGDTVRYLNAVGGGVITRIEGKVAFVDEDGFETPVMLKDIVVVLPAGHQRAPGGPRLMFDQQAFDNGRRPTPKSTATSTSGQDTKAANPVSKDATPPPAPEKVELTAHGDQLSLALAFEPLDIKKLSDTSFNAILVNDSNYTLLFSVSRRSDDDHLWHLVESGSLAPNELLDIARISLPELPAYSRIMIQGIALRKDAPFEMKIPFSFVRRMDLTKFHKLHCFRPGIYFDNPVIEVQLMDRDRIKGETAPESDLKKLAAKYEGRGIENKDEASHKSNKAKNDKPNPHKLLPLIEVDLHIGELTDSTVGMEPKDMLELQLDTVAKVMKEHSKRQGQKIVFIHGKGDGVLRRAVLDKLKREYPKAELQDASFREYGFGATLVTIH